LVCALGDSDPNGFDLLVRVGGYDRRRGRNSEENMSQVTHSLCGSRVIEHDFNRELPADEVQSPAKSKNRGQFSETR
jgi:hypothetical protein